jgi:hypothetical protein
MSADRIERARLLYERSVFDGDASALAAADRELDAVEADLGCSATWAARLSPCSGSAASIKSSGAMTARQLPPSNDPASSRSGPGTR